MLLAYLAKDVCARLNKLLYLFIRFIRRVATESSKCPRRGIFAETGPVDQSGMIAAFATRKPRVQIPLGPPVDIELLENQGR